MCPCRYLLQLMDSQSMTLFLFYFFFIRHACSFYCSVFCCCCCFFKLGGCCFGFFFIPAQSCLYTNPALTNKQGPSCDIPAWLLFVKSDNMQQLAIILLNIFFSPTHNFFEFTCDKLGLTSKLQYSLILCNK